MEENKALELELYAEELPEQLNYSAAAAATVASALTAGSFAGSTLGTASSYSTAG